MSTGVGIDIPWRTAISTSMSRRPIPSVFDYLDYRAFLRDYYTEQKAHGRRFSFRAFSRRADVRSPNYLKLVMDGERNLTPAMAGRFAQACGLDDEASAYFVNLVAFNQAGTVRERNAHYQALTAHSDYRKAHRLDLAHAAYHATWYLPAIRELVATEGFREDAGWIAAKLIPPIRKSDAQQALNTLVQLGLLVRDDEGRLRQAEPAVSTGPEVRALHIANYHRSMMQRAAEAIDEVPPSERDISSLTLSLSGDGLRRFKARIQRFREELAALSLAEDDPQQVIQINFQLFPLSKGGEE